MSNQLDPISDAFAEAIARKVVAAIRPKSIADQKPDQVEFLRTREASKRLHRSVQWVRDHKSVLGGVKEGRDLIFPADRIDGYYTAHLKRGA